jgi:two-component sensor histidine kinase
LKELVISGELAVDLAAVFDASPNPYVLLTPDLRIAGCNSAYLAITQSEREAIIGRPLFGAFTAGDGEDAPENIRQVRESLDRALTTRRPEHLALVKFAMARLQPDGTTAFEDRLWSATHTPIMDRDGRVIYLLQHTTDITELEELRRLRAASRAGAVDASALDIVAGVGVGVGGDVLRRAAEVQQANRELESERRRLLELFMQAPGFIAVLDGPDHVFQMHNPAYAQLIGHRDITGRSVRDALPELADQGYLEFLDHVYQTGEPYEGLESRVELQRIPGAPLEEVFLNFVYQPIRNDEGRVVGIFVQGHDVTNDVLAAERQKLMIDELNHRVKNTLATVQSIAIQTARSHDDPRAFAQTFQSRIMALSHTHDLLTQRMWEGAELHDVLRHETDAYGPTRISLNGPAVALIPAQAVSLGMVFHELATNAAKYGALSTPDGRVLIDWSIADLHDRKLHIAWRETGGPPVVMPERRGFGSRLIERNLKHDLAGTLQTDYAPAGLVAEMTVSLENPPGERASA